MDHRSGAGVNPGEPSRAGSEGQYGSTQRLGWITQILGTLTLLRLIPEVPFMNSTWGRDYWGLVWADLALGLLAFAAGWALRRGMKGSWAGTCFFWGAEFSITALTLIWLGPYLGYLFRHDFSTPGDIATTNRFLLYALELAVAPYALWSIVRRTESPTGSRRPRWIWSLAGMASASVYFYCLIYRP
jgi:hypothetical protein